MCVIFQVLRPWEYGFCSEKQLPKNGKDNCRILSSFLWFLLRQLYPQLPQGSKADQSIASTVKDLEVLYEEMKPTGMLKAFQVTSLSPESLIVSHYCDNHFASSRRAYSRRRRTSRLHQRHLHRINPLTVHPKQVGRLMMQRRRMIQVTLTLDLMTQCHRWMTLGSW